jgi:predicted P-loop ATPase
VSAVFDEERAAILEADGLTTEPRAEVTMWASLTDTTGMPKECDWLTWFARLSAASPFQGKDRHPGWSAATFEPCLRATTNVRSLSAAVLDYDGGATIAEAVGTWRACFGFLHTTKSNTPEAPRFRVVLPFSRPVTPGEYQRIWKVLDARTGHTIDRATKDPCRFWYEPGSEHPEHFETRNLEGAPLDPDELLCEVPPPVPATPPPPVMVSAAKGRPDAETRAVKYLEKLPPAIQGKNGSGATFAACEAVANGFDLGPEVASRLVFEHYNPRCVPPWSDAELLHKCQEPAGGWKLGRGRLLRAERCAPPSGPRSVATKPAESIDPPEDDAADELGPGAWETSLVYQQGRTGSNEVDSCTANAVVILGNDAPWRAVLAFDDFAQGVVTLRSPPWDPADATPDAGPGPWSDVDTVRAMNWLRRHWSLSLTPGEVANAVAVVSQGKRFHPVREYVEGLAWDLVPRIDTWLATYLGAKDTPYARNVGRWFLTSALARIYRPGEKVDTMPILEGAQGTGKSTAMSVMFSPWFSDTPLDLQSKDRFIALRGVWGYELAELDSFGRSDAARIKSFTSSPHDDFRPPYGRTSVRVPRRCVFVGTINPGRPYLSDETGGRRFWPVKTGRIDLDALRRDRDQLWAEARVWFEHGHKWWPEGDEVELCQEQQAERQERDEWESVVAPWLARKPADAVVTLGDVLRDALNIETDKWDRADQMRAAAVMRANGWARCQVRDGNARFWAYRHGIE